MDNFRNFKPCTACMMIPCSACGSEYMHMRPYGVPCNPCSECAIKIQEIAQETMEDLEKTYADLCALNDQESINQRGFHIPNTYRQAQRYAQGDFCMFSIRGSVISSAEALRKAAIAKYHKSLEALEDASGLPRDVCDMIVADKKKAYDIDTVNEFTAASHAVLLYSGY